MNRDNYKILYNEFMKILKKKAKKAGIRVISEKEAIERFNYKPFTKEQRSLLYGKFNKDIKGTINIKKEGEKS
jgi:hypothetical protein